MTKAPTSGITKNETSNVTTKTSPLTRARRESRTRISSMIAVGLSATPIAAGMIGTRTVVMSNSLTAVEDGVIRFRRPHPSRNLDAP